MRFRLAEFSLAYFLLSGDNGCYLLEGIPSSLPSKKLFVGTFRKGILVYGVSAGSTLRNVAVNRITPLNDWLPLWYIFFIFTG